MRLMVFFDLPTKTAEDRKIANSFRRFLINDGYYMVQFSLYTRLCSTIENVGVHENRLSMNIPNKGSVRSMAVTEKQFSNIKILVGEPRKRDKKVSENQISFF
ncbi:MAG: CRISPR-associated endonuclease Cas2 [Clostridia bacterium]